MEILRYKTPAGFNGVANRLARLITFRALAGKPNNSSCSSQLIISCSVGGSWEGTEKIQ